MKRVTAVDIGNTRAHLGTFTFDDQRGHTAQCRAITHTSVTSPRLYSGTVAYASVNPAVERRFITAVRRATGTRPHRLGRDFPAAIRNHYRPPSAAGLDRLANAAAAWWLMHRACVVVDLGTAITFDIVNARGEFIGGLIAPGLRLQAQSLHNHTALLPEVAPSRVRRTIARTTHEAISAGVSLGIEGLIRTGIDGIRRELRAKPVVIGTGGDAALYHDLFDEVHPELTLTGIAISYALAQR